MFGPVALDDEKEKEEPEMTLEPCPDCGRMILVHLMAQCDPSPLDGQGVAAELSRGRKIWTPIFGPGLIPQSLRPAVPGDAKLLREHDCTPASRPNTPPAVPAPPKDPRSPSGERVAPRTPSSERPTERSSARRAGPRLSERLTRVGEGPVCDACSQPTADGTYASIEVGSLVVWAEHIERCEGET